MNVLIAIMALLPNMDVGELYILRFERLNPPVLGTADCRTRTVTVSLEFALHAKQHLVDDVISHEVAHLVTGCTGHTPEWRAQYEILRGAF